MRKDDTFDAPAGIIRDIYGASESFGYFYPLGQIQLWELNTIAVLGL